MLHMLYVLPPVLSCFFLSHNGLSAPHQGMDAVARRKVWDLILRVKEDRVMILTTHSMEEADVLGDRIGIMKEGRLICLGTSSR